MMLMFILSDRLFGLLVIICLSYLKYVQTDCDLPLKKMKLTFIDGKTLGKPSYKHQDTTILFGDILHFYGKEKFDFTISEDNGLLQDELFSIIMVKQSVYPRLEPDGEIELKWFVANVPGENLLKGQDWWNGVTLADFKPIKKEENKEDTAYHMLWIFKHIDSDTLLEEAINEYDQNNFSLQMFYDYFCSKPWFEIIFTKNVNVNHIKDEINSVKRIQN